MKRFLALAVAIAAVLIFCQNQNVNAQGYGSGYQFGKRKSVSSCGLGFTRGFQREQPPYFCKVPTSFTTATLLSDRTASAHTQLQLESLQLK